MISKLIDRLKERRYCFKTVAVFNVAAKRVADTLEKLAVGALIVLSMIGAYNRKEK